jgi:hypothetical protein
VIISILTAVFAVLSAHFAYKLFDSIENGGVSEAIHSRPEFAFRTFDEYLRCGDYPFTLQQLPAFVKGLFISIRAGRLFGRVRKAARDVHRKPALLCNIFLWVFVFLLPLLIAAQGVVGLMTFMCLPVPNDGHGVFSESDWMSQ